MATKAIVDKGPYQLAKKSTWQNDTTFGHESQARINCSKQKLTSMNTFLLQVYQEHFGVNQ